MGTEKNQPVKGLIVDLDWCIVDNRCIGDDVMEPVWAVLRTADIAQDMKQNIREGLEIHSLADVLCAFDVPEVCASRLHSAYQTIEAPALVRSFGDEACLKELSVRKILVTSGYERFQRGKIQRLGLADLFDEIIIDEQDKPEARKGKLRIFKDILDQYKWGGGNVCVIGDNPLSELAAGKTLGMITFQILRPGVRPADGFDYYIHSLIEVVDFINRKSA